MKSLPPFCITLALLLMSVSGRTQQATKSEMYFQGRPLYHSSHALLVGVDDSPNAHECAASIQQMAGVLQQWQFPPQQIHLLSETQATHENIVTALQTLIRTVSKEDRVIVDLCLHGRQRTTGGADFVAWNTNKSLTDRSPCLLPMEQVLRLFVQIPCRHKLLIADACYSGALSSGLTPARGTINLVEVAATPSTSVWVSSEPNRQALLDGGGLTHFHKTLFETLARYDQDLHKPYSPLLLRDLERRVSEQMDSFTFGGVNRSITQMILAAPTSHVVALDDSVVYQQYDPESVRQAVAELKEQLDRPGLSKEQQARLHIELAKALLSRTEAIRRSEDVKDAIQGLRAARAYFETQRRSDLPDSFAAIIADIDILLGNAYRHLPTGNNDENLKKAVGHFEEALKIYSEQVSPQSWAEIQFCLGGIYSDLLTGSKEANLKKAVACYEEALKVHTEREYPQPWASIKANLGRTYSDFLTGNREENIRKAIGYYEEALKIQTEKSFPQEWARTQHKLGNAYFLLPAGNKDQNLKKAIQCYEEALRVQSEKDFPRAWATIRSDLGLAYSRLLTSNRDENLKKAIGCYEETLKVHTEREYPREWANTQFNLGNAYSQFLAENREANLKKAIGYYEAALRIQTEMDTPLTWAITQYKMGSAYALLPAGDKDQNLKKAIGCFEATLSVNTEKAYPEYWAVTQINLGYAYFSLSTGNREENLTSAINHYEAGLKIRTEQEYPQFWPKDQFRLGKAYRLLGRDAAALTAFRNAVHGYHALGDLEGEANAQTDIRKLEGKL